MEGHVKQLGVMMLAAVSLVSACGGSASDEPTPTTTEVAVTNPPVTTTSISTTTTLPPTTTTLPPTTTTTTESSAGLRQPLVDQAAEAGWVKHDDPLGWSMWMPSDWSVETDGTGTAIISVPDLAVIGVLAVDDTEGIVDSEDYLIRSLAEALVSGFIASFDFSPDDAILDVNQDGINGPYDIWGVPVEMGDGSPGWAYAYYDPTTPSDLGYDFNVIDLMSTGTELQETAEAVLLTFEPAGGY